MFTGAQPAMDTDPRGFLLCWVLGTTQLPLPPNLGGFTTTFVAAHLDPFIDGELTDDDERCVDTFTPPSDPQK